MELPSKFVGSGFTKTRVYAYRHNRHPQKEGEFNISSLVTQVSVDQHLTGGGRCTLTCVGQLPIEDNLVANDIINVYINTGRSQEEYEYADGDNTWKYNKGWVRTFFGYIDSISRHTSISSDGNKQTLYYITCSSFDKAVRSTEVYVNPHLTFSGEAENGKPADVTRADIGTNLGGLLLLQKGFMIAGTPRQLILSHLLRSLGFGAQWLLPLGYQDSLYEYNTFVKFNIEENSEAQAAKNKKDFKFTVSLNEISPNMPTESNGERLLSNTLFEVPATGVNSIYAAKSQQNGVKDDLREALIQVATEARLTRWTSIGLLAEEFGLIADTISGLEELENGTILFVGGLHPALEKKIEEKLFGNFSSISHNGKSVASFVPNKKFKELGFKKSVPVLTPNINQTTQVGQEHATAAHTLFNILCLDYLEEVDGHYVLSQMYNFGGPLSSQLNSQSHDLINEFYFDLRPAPDFIARDKDGLGHDIDGAIPMVPAVVLREKPYTIYKHPKAKLTDVSSSNVITTGGVEIGEGFSDQLFIKLLNQRGFRRFSGADFDRVSDAVKDLGIVPQKVASLEKPETKGKDKVGAKKKPDGGKPNPKKTDNASKSGATNVVDPQKLQVGNREGFDLAERPYSLLFSLPRPVFASPDGGRVTLEAKVSSQETILGVISNEKVPNKDDRIRVKFQVVGTSNPAKGISTDHFKGKKLDYFNTLPLGSENWTSAQLLDTMSNSKFLALGPNSTKKTLEDEVKTAPKKSWHVLEFMTIRSSDILDESYYRGDQSVLNVLELFGDINPDFEFQKAILSDKLPIITPISIQRAGVRVSSNITSFVQHLLTGGPASHAWNAALGYRWVTMLDIWNQHNHELLTGSISLKGMPGLRPGYRIDRPELKLSFYVESVGHEWTFPGSMTTRISVTRGQPTNWGEQERILDYIPPEPNKPSNEQQRIKLGNVFSVNSEQDKGGSPESIRPPPGSVIGLPEKFTQKDLDGKG